MVAATGAAMADQDAIESRYSALSFRDCPPIQEYALGGTVACPGLDGWTVLYAEDDLRQFIGLQRPSGRGVDAVETEMVGAGDPRFNYTGETLEWRGRVDRAGWRPEALILRWFLEDLGADTTPATEQILRVMRVDLGGPGAPTLCPIGTVQVADNPDHNADARAVADRAILADLACARPELPPKPRG